MRSGSSEMQRMVQNSSGMVAGMGWTFLSTVLYFRTRAGSTGGSGGNRCGAMTCSDGSEMDGGERLTTEMTWTAGARPVQGRVEMYTLREMLAGLHTEISTLVPGRSSNRQRSACWKGRLRRRPKEASSTTCAWILNNTSPTCSVRFSAHPTVQLVAPFAPSILMSCCVLI